MYKVSMRASLVKLQWLIIVAINLGTPPEVGRDALIVLIFQATLVRYPTYES
jgi:hypothetical protein